MAHLSNMGASYTLTRGSFSDYNPSPMIVLFDLWDLHASDINLIPGEAMKIWRAEVGIIFLMRPANEKRRYILTSSLIGWAHTQNYPRFSDRQKTQGDSNDVWLTENIKAETKLIIFCRQHFHKHFLEWKWLCVFIQASPNCSFGSNW